MSQASRYKALAPVRIRGQVARELAANIVLVKDGGRFRASDSLAVYRRDDVSRWARRMLGGGLTFDVHAAREHARSLVALEAEQTAFEDWTRGPGLGPENREPGAFVCRECRGYGGGRGDGWTWSCVQCTSRPHISVHVDRGGWPGKLARQWGGDSRAPMGRSLARLGRHILAALEGQPSECQGLCATLHGSGGRHWVSKHGNTPNPGDTVMLCPDCQGTGHNLRGVLGPVEWSPQVRRKVADAHRHADRTSELRSWPFAVHHDRNVWGRTRVTARGEHRGRPMPFSDITTTADRSWAWHGVRPMWTRGLPAWDAHMARLHELLPRWRRGELKHAEQRRAKEARAFADDVRRAVAVIR